MPDLAAKGRRERALPFGRTTAVALDRYLRVRARPQARRFSWLWLGLKGWLTAWGLVSMLRRRSRQAGLTCIPTSSAIPSHTSGLPKAVERPT